MDTTKKELINKFKKLTVKYGLYKSEDRFLFRARQVFRNVNLINKSILEIGCGTGVYSVWAKLNGAKLAVGLEPEVDGCEDESSNIFKKFISELSIDNTECIPQIIEEYKPNGLKFDIVLSNNSINHLDENACMRLDTNLDAQEKYLVIFKKIKSLMNHNGKLIILDNSDKNFFKFLNRNSPFCRGVDFRKHKSPKVWVRLLKQANFSEPKISWPSRYFYLKNLYCPKLLSFFLDSYFRLEMES
ncbi:MAG: hypothetical protein A2166_00400 [Omnitrophica WOR_2 bacterium RBG_13_41_10]|nr:MAG: hypothetical protein A2166_00400 [Omnitrophica WOR_2 bacterium RBG_13_41_10]